MFRQSPPQVPMALMFAGVIPFISTAGLMFVWRDTPQLKVSMSPWLLVYAALILSFLGGVRWGIEIAKRERPRFAELGPATLGALMGWGLVMAAFQQGFPSWVFVAMMIALVLHFLYDIISPDMPLWYRRLRLWPTLGAVGSLVLAAILLSGS